MKRIRVIMILCLLLGFGLAANAQFDMPSIPKTITQPQQRAVYLLEHYWDRCNVASPSMLGAHLEGFEQHFVNFLSVFPYADSSAQARGVKNLFAKASASPKVYKQLLKWSEKYLYEPNSPMLNEDFYIVFLKEVINGKVLTKTEKFRPQEHLKYASLNRPGSVAADFRYTLYQGGETSLSKSLGSNQTLLIFYDSECEHCNEVMTKLKNDKQLTKDVKNGKMKVIAVCITGSKQAWRSHRAVLPAGWTVGYAQNDFDELEIYSIRAFPTIYLLDSNRKVLQKDIRL